MHHRPGGVIHAAGPGPVTEGSGFLRSSNRAEGGTPLLFLFLAVSCSTSIALVFHVSGKRGTDRFVVTAVNYAVATLISVVLMSLQGLRILPGETTGAFGSEFSAAISGAGFGRAGSLGWAFVVGIPSGVLYYLGFIFLQRAIRECGVSLSGSFSKMGVIVPMLLSLVLWNEIPGTLQWLGISLALISIVLGSLDFSGLSKLFSAFRPVLLLLFLTVGLAEFTNKIFQTYAVLEMRNAFLFFVFFTAMMISMFKVFQKRPRLELPQFLTGVAVGVPNYFASFFLIQALTELRAVVVFPVYSSLTICLISLLGWLLFGERLGRRERLSVVMAAVAMILVNL